MNATPSIAGLLKFIASQPSARPVDHSSYATCAVGAYAREVLGHEIPVASVGHATREQIDAVRADPVFPTSVGMNRSAAKWPPPSTRVPHVRGDEPQ